MKTRATASANSRFAALRLPMRVSASPTVATGARPGFEAELAATKSRVETLGSVSTIVRTRSK